MCRYDRLLIIRITDQRDDGQRYDCRLQYLRGELDRATEQHIQAGCHVGRHCGLGGCYRAGASFNPLACCIRAVRPNLFHDDIGTVGPNISSNSEYVLAA
jgi:hypothetical protein